MNREGFYGIYYAAGHGAGLGLIVLDSGIVVGCDGTGTTYDGTYEYNPRTDMLDATVVMKLADGAVLVTGRPASTLPREITINGSFSREIGRPQPSSIEIAGGTISIVFRKLRDFPNA